MSSLLYPEVCPACGGYLHRSRSRGIIEKAMSHFLKIRVFRCRRCRSRFYSKPAYVYRAREVEEHSLERKTDEKDGIAADRLLAERDKITGSEETSGELRAPELVCSPAPARERKRQSWAQQTAGNGVAKSAVKWKETSTSSARNSKPL
jgi:hypothetical protein